MSTITEEPITSFRGEFHALSNFFASPIKGPLGLTYANVEAAFQASKTDIEEEILSIQKLNNPVMAKRMGRKVTLRPDWNEVKLEYMRMYLMEKFGQPGKCQDVLLSTGDRELIEMLRGRVTWCNHLGKLLMEIRDELRSR